LRAAEASASDALAARKAASAGGAIPEERSDDQPVQPFGRAGEAAHGGN
jgi:hypothetical protein